MKLFYILLLLFLLSCQNVQSDTEENINIGETQTEIHTETDSVSVIEESTNINEFDLYCNEEGLIEITDSVSKYISHKGLKIVNKALNVYSKIETDLDMAEFYHNFLSEVADTLENVFFKYKVQFEESDMYVIEDWNELLGDCIPFMIYTFDNTFDGPSAYISYTALSEKSEQTSGEADEAFFEALMICFGSYNAAYSGIHNEMIACDISTSTYGNGQHLEAVESIIHADSVSTLFKDKLVNLADYVLSEEEIITFGYSKDEVYNEINQILSLKNRIKFDFSKVEKLKLFIDTTSRKLYFNCLDGSCPP